MDIGIIIILILAASIIYSLYKKKYNSAVGIAIMLVVYLLIKNRVSTG